MRDYGLSCGATSINAWPAGLFLAGVLLILCGCAPLVAQEPVKEAVKDTAKDTVKDTVKEAPGTGIGYSYQLPPQWAVVAVAPPPAPVSAPAPLVPKKGTACISVPQTARRGTPASVIVVVELPFDCYGETMTAPDLASFGAGITDGLKQTFDLADPILGGYTLGSHSVWIERARGNPKGKTPPQAKAQPPYPYTVEVACSLLTKAAVCWLATAADEASLHDFEAMPVELDTDAATALVPSTAFDKPPATP